MRGPAGGAPVKSECSEVSLLPKLGDTAATFIADRSPALGKGRSCSSNSMYSLDCRWHACMCCSCCKLEAFNKSEASKSIMVSEQCSQDQQHQALLGR